MINKNNPQSMIHGDCSPAHLLTCPLSHFPRSSGFSLLELLAVAAILALAAAVATPIFFDKTDQKRFQRTVESMAEIKKAILGVTSDRVRGDVRFAGYVQDMGELPELFYVTKKGKIAKVKEDDRISDILKDCKYPPQPKGLWTSDLDEDKKPDFIPFKAYAAGFLEFIRIGWRGSYLKSPSSGLLVDGWRNPFVFENNKGDLVITSLGADNKDGGEGFDRDIAQTIRKTDYTGSVSGYVSPQSVFLEKYEDEKIEVRIYYTPLMPIPSDCEQDNYLKECIDYMKTTANCDGYFHFKGVPIGTQRLLMVVQEAAGERVYKLAVEPGTMWLGTLGVVH